MCNELLIMTPQTKGIIFCLTAAILWGISGTFAQFVFQNRAITPEWLTTWRLSASGLTLLIWAYSKEGKQIFAIWFPLKQAIALVFFAIFGMLAVQLTYFVAIKHSNAATATVLQYMAPAIIALVLTIQYRKPPTIREIIAISLALLGIFLLVTHGSFTNLSITGKALFWGIASAFTMVLYTLFPLKLLAKYGARNVVGWAMLIGGLFSSLLFPTWHFEGQWDGYTLLAMVFIVPLGSLIAFYLYLASFQHIGGGKASILISAEPLAATVFSVIFLGVQFGLLDWIGSFCIILTIFLLARTTR